MLAPPYHARSVSIRSLGKPVTLVERSPQVERAKAMIDSFVASTVGTVIIEAYGVYRLLEYMRSA